ncbi:MAG TPA: NAD(P)/FAD-dependent oxidoreductase [Thermoanaerobaculia bacterium]|nr:NAD(P)/FAD-dependent oxidoreductase [Thermoanaerobaculia bacterium]
MNYDFDFAVAGGGPAGSSAAIALAQRGHSVVLFEREAFPRFHIGESLLSTANDAFAVLGLAERMAAANFPVKWGARLFTHDGMSGRGVDFATVTEVMRPQTYQVPRSEFDRILMERAREAGVDVRERHRVTACDFTPEAAVLEVERNNEERFTIRVRALVDATGRQGLIAKKFNLRTDEPRLANIAVFSHYSNVPLIEGERPNDIRIVARSDSGWFWLIPISAELMSVGVVLPKKLFLQMPDGTNEERLERAIADTPLVARLMQDARREWPVRVEKDFSYRASSYAGDRWILAGDAGSFLDPVFSTGVSIAMESGIEAAAELDRALRRNNFSARSFAAFSRRQRRRYETFRQFVIGFYSPQFRDLFFDPEPPRRMFQAVVTVLSGRWNARLRTRLMNAIFFALVALQKRFTFVRGRFRRDATAGYP